MDFINTYKKFMENKIIVELDELELYLNMLIEKDSKLLITKTYLEIAILIENEFNVKCTEHDINLLYDPTIDEIIEDNEILYKQVLGL